jgi:hypothetical protein
LAVGRLARPVFSAAPKCSCSVSPTRDIAGVVAAALEGTLQGDARPGGFVPNGGSSPGPRCVPRNRRCTATTPGPTSRPPRTRPTSTGPSRCRRHRPQGACPQAPASIVVGTSGPHEPIHHRIYRSPPRTCGRWPVTGRQYSRRGPASSTPWRCAAACSARSLLRCRRAHPRSPGRQARPVRPPDQVSSWSKNPNPPGPPCDERPQQCQPPVMKHILDPPSGIRPRHSGMIPATSFPRWRGPLVGGAGAIYDGIGLHPSREDLDGVLDPLRR